MAQRSKQPVPSSRFDVPASDAAARQHEIARSAHYRAQARKTSLRAELNEWQEAERAFASRSADE